MRATEIIRNILNIIDQVEQPEVALTITEIDTDDQEQNPWSSNRQQQIVDLLPDEDDMFSPFSNSPTPKISGIESVIMSGDDINKSKQPSDIRSNSISMYPNFQAKE